MDKRVIIIGGGHAGFQAAESLRLEGFTGSIQVITSEPYLPYHKPPLSKGFLSGKQNMQGLYFRPAAFYEKNKIELILAERVISIQALERTVLLSCGSIHHFDKLIMATGCKARKLPLENIPEKGIFILRDLDDALLLKAAMSESKHAVVIGAGFIGLEFAAAAVEKGMQVTVVEAQPRIMSRVLPEILSELFLRKHKEHGVHILTGVQVKKITGAHAVSGIELDDGTMIDAGMVVAGIGVTANDELAARAGLACMNGIIVNEYLQTSFPDIYAIGDCALHENKFAGKQVRLESVQNAVDQARTVAISITGNPKKFHAVPWFWTDQYDVKLQMAGFSAGYDSMQVRSFSENKFSLLYYRSEKLIGVDSVNAPADHLAARKLLAAGISPSMPEVGNPEVKLSEFIC